MSTGKINDEIKSSSDQSAEDKRLIIIDPDIILTKGSIKAALDITYSNHYAPEDLNNPPADFDYYRLDKLIQSLETADAFDSFLQQDEHSAIKEAIQIQNSEHWSPLIKQALSKGHNLAILSYTPCSNIYKHLLFKLGLEQDQDKIHVVAFGYNDKPDEISGYIEQARSQAGLDKSSTLFMSMNVGDIGMATQQGYAAHNMLPQNDGTLNQNDFDGIYEQIPGLKPVEKVKPKPPSEPKLPGVPQRPSVAKASSEPKLPGVSQSPSAPRAVRAASAEVSPSSSHEVPKTEETHADVSEGLALQPQQEEQKAVVSHKDSVSSESDSEAVLNEEVVAKRKELKALQDSLAVVTKKLEELESDSSLKPVEKFRKRDQLNKEKGKLDETISALQKELAKIDNRQAKIVQDRKNKIVARMNRGQAGSSRRLLARPISKKKEKAQAFVEEAVAQHKGPPMSLRDFMGDQVRGGEQLEPERAALLKRVLRGSNAKSFQDGMQTLTKENNELRRQLAELEAQINEQSSSSIELSIPSSDSEPPEAVDNQALVQALQDKAAAEERAANLEQQISALEANQSSQAAQPSEKQHEELVQLKAELKTVQQNVSSKDEEIASLQQKLQEAEKNAVIELLKQNEALQARLNEVQGQLEESVKAQEEKSVEVVQPQTKAVPESKISEPEKVSPGMQALARNIVTVKQKLYGLTQQQRNIDDNLKREEKKIQELGRKITSEDRQHNHRLERNNELRVDKQQIEPLEQQVTDQKEHITTLPDDQQEEGKKALALLQQKLEALKDKVQRAEEEPEQLKSLRRSLEQATEHYSKAKKTAEEDEREINQKQEVLNNELALLEAEQSFIQPVIDAMDNFTAVITASALPDILKKQQAVETLLEITELNPTADDFDKTILTPQKCKKIQSDVNKSTKILQHLCTIEKDENVESHEAEIVGLFGYFLQSNLENIEKELGQVSASDEETIEKLKHAQGRLKILNALIGTDNTFQSINTAAESLTSFQLTWGDALLDTRRGQYGQLYTYLGNMPFKNIKDILAQVHDELVEPLKQALDELETFKQEKRGIRSQGIYTIVEQQVEAHKEFIKPVVTALEKAIKAMKKFKEDSSSIELVLGNVYKGKFEQLYSDLEGLCNRVESKHTLLSQLGFSR